MLSCNHLICNEIVFSTVCVRAQSLQFSLTMNKLMVEKSHDSVGDEYSTELQALAGFPQWLCLDVCLTNDFSHFLEIKMNGRRLSITQISVCE